MQKLKGPKRGWLGVVLMLACVASSCGLTESSLPDVPFVEQTPSTTTKPKKAIPLVMPTNPPPSITIELSSVTEGIEVGSTASVDADTATQTNEESPEQVEADETPNGVDIVSAALATLVVADEYLDGYDRELFKHWTDIDGDGCNARKEVLFEEAIVVPSIGNGCSFSGGSWWSRYDGATEEGSGTGFDVDHLVPLKEAWDSGAHAWTDEVREAYANDLSNVDALIAVSASSNRSKGAQDPSEWLPPDSSQYCWYASAWIGVKVTWQLTVDVNEKAALVEILATCTEEDF